MSLLNLGLLWLAALELTFLAILALPCPGNCKSRLISFVETSPAMKKMQFYHNIFLFLVILICADSYHRADTKHDEFHRAK